MPSERDCLDPKQVEYRVTELESAYGCKSAEATDLRVRLTALQRAVRRRQQITAQARQAAK